MKFNSIDSYILGIDSSNVEIETNEHSVKLAVPIYPRI